MTSSRPASTRPRARPTAAFTLVELLVASAVTAVLVTIMLGVTLNTLRAWNQSQGLLATNAVARQVFGELTQDLQGLMQRTDGQVWLAATVQRPQERYGDAAGHEQEAYPEKRDKADWGAGGASDHSKPRAASESLHLPSSAAAPIDELRFGQAGVWLRFISTRGKPGDDASDGVSAVGYQLVRRGQKKHSTDSLYDLQRSAMRAGFSDDGADFGPGGYDLFAPGYHHYVNVNGLPLAAKIRVAERKNSLGADVIDFGLRIFEQNPATRAYVEVFPVNRRDGATSAPGSTPFTYALCSDPARVTHDAAVTGPLTRGRPGALRFEFMIRVLTPEGAKQIRAYEQNPDAFAGRSWWDVALPLSRTYTHAVSTVSAAM
jgi:hypothetical protein